MKIPLLRLVLMASLAAAAPAMAGHFQPGPPPRKTKPAPPGARPGAERQPRENLQVKPAAPRKGEPINDRAVFAYLEREGLKLVNAGKLPTNLLAQLHRKRCALELAPAGRQPLSPAAIASQAEDSVKVLAKFYNCRRCSRVHFASASGFVLSSSGALATSLHALGQSNFLGMAAMNRDGRLFPVREVLAADPLNDTAILQLEGEGFAPLPLSTQAPVGAPVTVLSHPSSHFFALTTGIVSRHVARPRPGGTTPFIAITAPFGVGSSGGPVFNEQGAVIGLANNTEPIYADHGDADHKVLQITLFNCTTAKAILDMVGKPAARGVTAKPPAATGETVPKS